MASDRSFASPPGPEHVEIVSRPNLASRTERLWGIAALVLAVLGVCCLPLIPFAWMASDSLWAVAGMAASALFWFVLAAACWVFRGRVRRGARAVGDTSRPLIAATRDSIVLAGSTAVPYRDLAGLRFDERPVVTTRRARTVGARAANTMTEQAMESSGSRTYTEISLLVPAHRFAEAPPGVDRTISVRPAEDGLLRVTVRCHPMLHLGSPSELCALIAEGARRAQVPALPDPGAPPIFETTRDLSTGSGPFG